MKDFRQADELVERVFASLRETEAEGGLEERILCAMGRQSAKSIRSGWTGWRPGLGWTGGIALATASLVMVAIMVTRPTPPPSQSAAQTHSRVATLKPNTQQTAAPTRSSALPSTAGYGQSEGMHKGASVHATDRAHLRDVATQEARAPSIVAPPLPLTASEVLLQQCARRGHPKISSPLNPEVRAKERLQAAVEFADFFTPPSVTGGNQ